jgi:RNA polymerase sigma factor (sigma-70 family)
MNSPDDELWQRFKRGDGASLVELLRRYHDDLYRYGLKLAHGDVDTAKDAIQEVFVELWARREHLADVRFVKSYLLTALRRNLYRQHLLVLREQAEADTLAQEGGLEFSPEDFLVAQLGEEERRHKLHAALNQLTKRQREAVYLKFYEELSYEQIADVMGIGAQPVYNLIHQALKGLRQCLLPGTGLVCLLLAAG